MPPGVMTLFKDLNIYFTTRVPHRSQHMASVRSFGGTVAPSDKRADVVIGDHARKDQPVGSLSYRWIEECVKQQRLVHKDGAGMRAGPKLPKTRPVGAPKTASAGRTPFSDADDQLVSRWVAEQMQHGAKDAGNIIYQQLEEKVRTPYCLTEVLCC